MKHIMYVRFYHRRRCSKNSAKKKQKEKEVSPVPEIEEESTPVPRRSRASGKAESNQADSANETSSSKKVVKRSVEFSNNRWRCCRSKNFLKCNLDWLLCLKQYVHPQITINFGQLW